LRLKNEARLRVAKWMSTEKTASVKEYNGSVKIKE